MKIIIVCFILSLSALGYGDGAYMLKGNVAHMANNKVELLDCYGDKNNVIDLATVSVQRVLHTPSAYASTPLSRGD